MRTVKDPYVRANARAKVLHRDTDPNVVAYSAEVQDKAKRNMKEQKKLKETKKKEERIKNRMAALIAYESTKMPGEDVAMEE